MKIEAAIRLRASWFDELTDKEKRKYVELHPDSKYAIQHDESFKHPENDDDKERIKELKIQIGYLVQDIEEIEADGDDASRERKLMSKLKAELNELTHTT